MNKISDRLISSAAAILLQISALALLAQSARVSAPPQALTRELTLLLPRLRQAPPASGTPGPPSPAAPRAVTVPQYPSANAPPAGLPASPDVRGLGRALFGCAPETYADLSAEDRARCPRPGDGMVMQREPNLMGSPTRTKHEAIWAAELGRKQAPFALPCFGGIDVLCLVRSVADGSIGDPKTWPVYETKKLAPEDLYKVQQAYDAWHREHPETREDAANAR